MQGVLGSQLQELLGSQLQGLLGSQLQRLLGSQLQGQGRLECLLPHLNGSQEGSERGGKEFNYVCGSTTPRSADSRARARARGSNAQGRVPSGPLRGRVPSDTRPLSDPPSHVDP